MGICCFDDGGRVKKVAFLFPGQGAQYPGMGRDFYEQFAVARATFDEADAFLGFAFSKQIFAGSKEELTLTKNSQMAIYITTVAILRTFTQECPSLVPMVCAGLSLGEYTALYGAGKISFLDGLDLVRLRGSAMQEACEEIKGTMQVVLGLSEEEIQRAIDELTLRDNEVAAIANLNCPGQVVIAGTLDGLDLLGKSLKERGAKRILPLDVSGAFHTSLMGSAQQKLREKIERIRLDSSEVGIVMNVPGDYLFSSDQIQKALIDQVVSPVRWEKGIRKMAEEGIELYIEMGPGKSLSGMNKRMSLSAPTVSIETVEDLNALVGEYAVIER